MFFWTVIASVIVTNGNITIVFITSVITTLVFIIIIFITIALALQLSLRVIEWAYLSVDVYALLTPHSDSFYAFGS